MGSALAERFLRAGLSVVGYDLSEDRRAALGAIGGEAAPGAAAAVRRADAALVLSLPTTDVVESVIAEIEPTLTPGLLVLDTTTGDPDRTAALGRRLAETRGVDYLDATVAGSSAQTRAGEVVVTAGGTAPGFARAELLLRHFAREVIHVGPWGAGSRMKLVTNLALGLHRAVLAEALCFARSCGLDPAAALRVLKAGPAYSRVMDTKGRKMLGGDFDPPEARLSQHLKDVRLILAAGQQAAARLPLTGLHETLLTDLEAAGLGNVDNSAIICAFD
jgi:3-hydroxyisobutyrate dehydrogenase-like beta-hydroxyacid dehydrogenase